jgi:hypothetical protein
MVLGGIKKIVDSEYRYDVINQIVSQSVSLAVGFCLRRNLSHRQSRPARNMYDQLSSPYQTISKVTPVRLPPAASALHFSRAFMPVVDLFTEVDFILFGPMF